ncbi:MAG: SUMF1/EgtB/PvdO family nonheme iron enzyme [Deltaproteobacteria bacterium]|nr:SUMF1/EgtB/PvdO family nonheme iron enzyme [Deltaproteobacteria bacterium]
MNTTQAGIASATLVLNGVTSVYDCEGYRLPTEAEWEYAARAGSTGATPNGDLDGNTACESPHPTLDSIAWFCGNDKGLTTGVGQLQANAWGLYDTLGNVSEWCWDWEAAYTGESSDPEGPATGSQRIRRGGSWNNDAWLLRTARRNGATPDYRYHYIGGRVARSAR